MATIRDLPHLDRAIDYQSFQWLQEEAPELTEAIEKEVAGGATPEVIGRWVMRRTQRSAIALRCEQAARHIARGRND